LFPVDSHDRDRPGRSLELAEPWTLANATRRAFLRAGCFGLLLVIPFAAGAGIADGAEPSSLLAGGVAGLIFGMTTGPCTILDELARRRPPSFRRELALATATAALATIALVAAFAQTVFAIELLHSGSVAGALSEAQRQIDRGFRVAPSSSLVFGLLPMTLPIVSVAVGRLRQRRLSVELAVGLACGFVVMWPTIVLATLKDVEPSFYTSELALTAIGNALAVVLLSCSCRLAERIDRRIVARLSA